jgi:hypothetical protein
MWLRGLLCLRLRGWVLCDMFGYIEVRSGCSSNSVIALL